MIVTNIKGHLINGQNRMTAVVNSDTAQWFSVLKDVPEGFEQVYDLGAKRTMEDRLCLAGKPITKAGCDLIRNVMTPYDNNVMGTSYYSSRPIHDEHVYDVYCLHKKAVDFFVDHKLTRPGLISASAVKVYIYLNNYLVNHGENAYYKKVAHKMDPWCRALHFYQLVKTGMSDMGPLVKETDAAAIELKKIKSIPAYQNNGSWSGKECFKWSLSYAYQFAVGKSLKRLSAPLVTDPMGDIACMHKTC